MRRVIFAIGMIGVAMPALALHDRPINVENWTSAHPTTIVSVTIGKTKTTFSPPIPASGPGEARAFNEMLGECLQPVAITFGNGQLFVIPANDPNAFDACHDQEIRVINSPATGDYILRFSQK